MKIYVDEERQDVRVDFGGEDYARTKVIQATGDVFTEVASTIWLPDALDDSELVYETPAPSLKWPTGENAVVEVSTPTAGEFPLFKVKGGWIDDQGDEWTEGEAERWAKLVRIIFEGEDNV